MTEEHTPEPKPHPTHIVEVYLQDGQTLGGAYRTDRYFYDGEDAAEASYLRVRANVEDAAARDNRAPTTLEVYDLYGKGLMIVRDLRGCRMFAAADLDEFDLSRVTARAGAIAAAKKAAKTMAFVPTGERP